MPLCGHTKKFSVFCVVCSESLPRFRLNTHLRARHFLNLSPSCGLCFEEISEKSLSSTAQDDQCLVKLETRANDTLKHLERAHSNKVGFIIYFIIIALYCSFAHKHFAHYKSVRICAILCTTRSQSYAKLLKTCADLFRTRIMSNLTQTCVASTCCANFSASRL